MNPALLKRIEACHGLPSLPAVALEVLALIRDPDCDMRRLAEVVQKDPAPRPCATWAFCCYGGEEMAVVLSGAGRARGAAVAAALRHALSSGAVECGVATPPLNVTASLGVAAYEPPGDGALATPALLVRAADRALYHAKQSGRNCVKVFHLAARSGGLTEAAAGPRAA